MYAVVETGGKQYKVSEGDLLSVERMGLAEGDEVVLDKVLLYSKGKTQKIGTPYVKGASVKAEVVENGKGEKIVIFKYKAKKNYRKKQGHRQPFTMIKITSIDMETKSSKKADEVQDQDKEV